MHVSYVYIILYYLLYMNNENCFARKFSKDVYTMVG